MFLRPGSLEYLSPNIRIKIDKSSEKVAALLQKIELLLTKNEMFFLKNNWWVPQMGCCEDF